MFLKIKAIRGPLMGEEIAIKGESTIGRSRGDLLIRDPKASNPHAKVYITAQGLVIIEDLNSSNGLFVNGQKVVRKDLKAGDIVTIGKSQFQVLASGRTEAAAQALAEGVQSLETESWQGVLSKEISGLPLVRPLNPIGIQALSPPITIEVTEGSLVGEKWTLGFGPRTVGSHSTDVSISEPDFPGEAFRVFSEDGETKIKSLFNGILINGKNLESHRLQSGDVISYGPIKIKVSI
ncbi:MAG: FHA domain-containing protein [Oligoflexia bacterium]|nr:FHA domain-containing protein [Oligoflexia bacterium]